MDHLMTTEDSYAERRQLFKNIWETAMTIEEKDADVMNKPKVIKTLRLDEVDRCGVSKKKKLKLKNLRHVCNKILDFCDRQEADDLFYEQMNAEGQEPTHHMAVLKAKVKSRRIKKKRIKKSKSLHSPNRSPAGRVTKSERKHEFGEAFPNKTSRNTSPIIVRRKSRQDGNKSRKSSATIKDLTAKGKKITKTKRDSHGVGKYKYYYYVDIKPIERAESPTKKLLRVHKVNIS